MICAECGSRYKRVTWTSRGKKRVVWRCISRLDYGKRYCKTSLTVDETALHAAIVRAINRFNEEDESTYMALMRATIGEAIGLTGGTDEIDLLRRKIDGLNRKMVSLINESVESGEGIESHEAEFKELSDTIELLQGRIQKLEEALASDQVNDSRILQTTADHRRPSIQKDGVRRYHRPPDDRVRKGISRRQAGHHLRRRVPLSKNAWKKKIDNFKYN